MIKAVLNNEILNLILEIEKNREKLKGITVPVVLADRLRKNSRKRSSYASNRIEGNPLTEEQAEKVIESRNRHFLKPEQEIRNYYNALKILEEKLKAEIPFSKKLILEIQKIVVKGESKEKSGFRGPMPPGILFAVYDDETGQPEYIPPEYSEIEELVDDLVRYVDESDDHPLIKAAIVHYQMVTIHPFEDGNGRTARLMSEYVLDYFGYGFNNMGSLEEYFAYDIQEYYSSLQMGLPVLYYSGRENPPHPEIWIEYFLRMMSLYSDKILRLCADSTAEKAAGSLSYLNEKERSFLRYILEKNYEVFTPAQIAKEMGKSNRTVINWCVKLVQNGFLSPNMVNERIRSYGVTDFAKDNRGEIL